MKLLEHVVFTALLVLLGALAGLLVYLYLHYPVSPPDVVTAEVIASAWPAIRTGGLIGLVAGVILVIITR